MVTQVRSFIDSHQIACAGPFLYAHILEVSETDFLRYVPLLPMIVDKIIRRTKFSSPYLISSLLSSLKMLGQNFFARHNFPSDKIFVTFVRHSFVR